MATSPATSRSAASALAPVLMAEVVRGGFVEGRHYGSVVVTAPDGNLEWSAGVVDQPMLPRSSNKPMQLLGMLRAGLELSGELLALAGSSHCGEGFQLDGVRRILAGAGLEESALRTPPGYPIDEVARDEWVRAGRGAAPITMNCSGKHAAMLATCVANGWPTASYREADHPLQRVIRAVLEEVSGEPVAATVVDGCGAPVMAITLAGLARSFGRLAGADPATPLGRIAGAFRAHPEYVSGTRRDEAALMRSVPGLVCKGGAEAVHAAGLADGRGIAVKIDDGAARAGGVVLAATLQRLGVDNELIRAQRAPAVMGGGLQVGSVRPDPALFG